MTQLCISPFNPSGDNRILSRQNRFAGAINTADFSHSSSISLNQPLNDDCFTKSSVHFGNYRKKPSPVARAARAVGVAGLAVVAGVGAYNGIGAATEALSGDNNAGTSISSLFETPSSGDTPVPEVTSNPPSAEPSATSSDKPTTASSLEAAKKLEAAFDKITDTRYQKILEKNNPPVMRKRDTNHRAIFVAHDTEVSFAKTMTFLAGPKAKASCHFVVDRDGKIYPLVPTNLTSFSVGTSSFHGEHVVRSNGPSANDLAFNVEMVMLHSMKDGDLTEAQIKSLAWLAVKSGIDPKRFTTHRDVAHDKAAAVPGNTDPHTDPRGFSYSKSNKLGTLFWKYYDEYSKIMKGDPNFKLYNLGIKR